MRRLTLSMLMTAALACGETGDTSATSGPTSTSDDSTATGAQTGTDGTTTTGDTTGPTSGSASASETGTTTVAPTGTTASETTEGTTAVDTTTTGTTAVDTTEGTTAVDTTAVDTTAVDTTGDTTDTGDTTGGTSPLVIAIVDAYLGADCMPVVDPDPVQGQWYVEFDNTANPDDTSAVVTAAWLSLADADPPLPEPIMVTPVESGPIGAGEYVSVKLNKLPGAAHSACEHCDEFYTLALEYDEGGVKHLVEEAVTIPCAF